MDSKFLNVYHDDPYDGNYVSGDADIWSTDNVVLENMELTDTLDGILPLTDTETENNTYCNLLFSDDHIYEIKENNTLKNSNVLVYNDLVQQPINLNSNEEKFSTNSNDLQGGSNNNNTTKHINTSVTALFEDDIQSYCSDASFRTRTDSSSIGDYESHSSDYDDTDDYDEDDVDDAAVSKFEAHDNEVSQLADVILTDLPAVNLVNGEEFMFAANGVKNRTMSSNTIGSDVDVADFDLAEFINNDDLPAVVRAPATKAAKRAVPSVLQQISESIEHEISDTESDSDSNSDAESDVIVDVETVEFEGVKQRALLLENVVAESNDDNLAFVDNVKADPEWNPKELKTKNSKQAPNKKICDFPKTLKTRDKNECNRKQILKSSQTIVQQKQKQTTGRHGLGKGGKNLALLKRDCESIEMKNVDTKSKDKNLELLKHDINSIDTPTKTHNTTQTHSQTQTQTKICSKEVEKRKLNLDEYKRRYNTNNLNMKTVNVANIANTTQNNTINHNNTKIVQNTSPKKVKIHSEAVSAVVRSLKEQQQQQKQQQQQQLLHQQQNQSQQQQQQQQKNLIIDPITMAKNKVLRMQELKRAQQMKIIDSTISAKVPRVTTLLPLQEIIKDTAYAIKTKKVVQEKSVLNPDNSDYVKIVMVSVACNTALTLSPADVLPNVPLLENANRVAEQVRISNNSLITSIQDAIVKQSLPSMSAQCSNVGNKSAQSTSSTKSDDKQQEPQHQHGEDKIIMHLRKDRIREQTCTIETQTDFQAAFPILQLPKVKYKSKHQKHSQRQYRRRQPKTHGREYDAAASATESFVYDDDANDSYSSDDNNERHRSTACVNSTDYQNMDNAAGSIGGYSSRSSRRHRSSISSSYSESGHQRIARGRKRRTSYRKHLNVSKHSRSSSSSSTLSDYSDRSPSRKRTRTRSRSRSRSVSPNYRNHSRKNSSINNVSKPAVEERRIVYVGRIEEETTKEMLRRKFIAYGTIKQITVHYKENGMKYGFVTFENASDAFSAIDSSARDSQINMYDISFGGRRAFCRTSYADLDNAGINNYHSYVFPKAVEPPKQEDSFEALLQKVKAKMNANKSSSQSSNKL